MAQVNFLEYWMSSSQFNRALITGASSGIGRATALAFADEGMAVALVSRSPSKLKVVVEEIMSQGGKAIAYPVDLAQTDVVKAQIRDVVADFGPIDILVNNAGMGYTHRLGDTPLSDWRRVLDLNLTSVFQCIQGILPSMREQGRGSIINIASIAAHSPFPGWGAYSVSKAGLIALSQGLAVEERGHGIRVTSLCPGAVDTAIWDSDTVQADLNRQAMLSPETIAQSILHIATLPDQAVVETMTILPSAGTL